MVCYPTTAMHDDTIIGLRSCSHRARNQLPGGKLAPRVRLLLPRPDSLLCGSLVQVAQYRTAAQLLADQGLTGRLLDTANWLLDPDGGGEASFFSSTASLSIPTKPRTNLPEHCKSSYACRVGRRRAEAACRQRAAQSKHRPSGESSGLCRRIQRQWAAQPSA